MTEGEGTGPGVLGRLSPFSALHRRTTARWRVTTWFRDAGWRRAGITVGERTLSLAPFQHLEPEELADFCAEEEDSAHRVTPVDAGARHGSGWAGGQAAAWGIHRVRCGTGRRDCV